MNPIRRQYEDNEFLSRLVIWIALLIAFAMGVYVIPKFGLIFADMLPRERLLWLTRIVISSGPTVLSVLAVSGAVLLILNDRRRWAPWLHNAMIFALSFAVGATVVALFTPIMRLLEQAAP